MRKAHNRPPSCAVVMKSGNLNLLEPSGPLQACNGTVVRLPLDALISAIYFRNKSLHVSDSSSVHHQEFFTVHKPIHTGLQTACEQDQQTCMTYTIAVSTVKKC